MTPRPSDALLGPNPRPLTVEELAEAVETITTRVADKAAEEDQARAARVPVSRKERPK